jgi:signal transduction histidine kinase
MASGGQRGPVSDPGEIHRLRNCISNLISLQALPAICAGREPSRHLSVLLEALIPMLHLAFVYARAIDTVGDRMEMVRVCRRQPTDADADADAEKIGRALEPWVSGDELPRSTTILNPIGEGQLSISLAWLGLRGDTGVLVAGSERLDFPTASDTLLLRVAANQAAIAIHEAGAAVRQRMVGRLSERTRIARELHDTLLQSFSGVLLRFQAVSSLSRTRPEQAQSMLDSAIDQGAQAVKECREAVQGLRASTTEPNDLAEAIKKFGDELAANVTPRETRIGSAAGTAFRVEVEGSARRLHPIVREEVYRIATEAIRNAFQHSGAPQIEVELHYDQRRVRLRVRDDGRGIDPQTLAARAREGHFGLTGMRERATLAGGMLTVWSSPGAGTEVELTIPASHAYAAGRSSDRPDTD